MHPKAVVVLLAFIFFWSLSFGQQQEWFDYYDPKDPRYHIYGDTTELCKVNESTGCTIENVFKLFLKNSKFIAPATVSQPVKNGNVYLLKLMLPGFELPGLHPIMAKVNGADHTVTNYTLPGHALHPGKVDRKIVQKGNALFLITKGTGYSNFGQFLQPYNGNCVEQQELLLNKVIQLGASFEEYITEYLRDINETPCIVSDTWGPVNALFVSEIKKSFLNPADGSQAGTFKINPQYITLSTDKNFRWYDWDKAPNDLKTATRYIHTYTDRETQKEVTLFEEITKKEGICEAKIAFIDLNEDGIAGIAVSYEALNCCGTLGCSYDIFDNGGLLTTGSDNAHGISPARNGIKVNDDEFVKLVSNPAIKANPKLAEPFKYNKIKKSEPNVPPSDKRTGAPTPSELGKVLLRALQINNKKLWVSCIHPETSEEFTQMITNRFDEWREKFIGMGVQNWNLVTFSRVLYTPKTKDGEKYAETFIVEFYYNKREFIGSFMLCGALTYEQKNYFTIVPCTEDVQFKRNGGK